MKILVSAYSCEPNKGSESEVGWRWSLKLAEKGHKVFAKELLRFYNEIY